MTEEHQPPALQRPATNKARYQTWLQDLKTNSVPVFTHSQASPPSDIKAQ